MEVKATNVSIGLDTTRPQQDGNACLLELQQVQILLRHGERAPFSDYFRNPALPSDWPYCNAAKELRSGVFAAGGWQTFAWRRVIERLGTNDATQVAMDTLCLPGELTDEGRRTTFAFGQRLRSVYSEQLKFLPAFLDEQHKSIIRLRSTPRARTVESVQQAFSGLYPLAFRSISPPAIVQREMKDETLTPNNAACKRLAELHAAFAARTAERWNDTSEMQRMNHHLRKWIPKDQCIRVGSAFPPSAIMDIINSTLAHGPATMFPLEFYQAEVQANVNRITTEEYLAGFQESSEFRKLGIGSLIGDLTQRMVEHTSSPMPPFKLSLAGCHDTTIGAVLASLGVFDYRRDKWPKFTSSVTFELHRLSHSQPAHDSIFDGDNHVYSPARSSKESGREPLGSMSAKARQRLAGYYVRVLFNDKSVTLPFCQAHGNHLDQDRSFCTLTAFKEAADIMTPKSWKSECLENTGIAPFFDKVQHVSSGVGAN